MLLKCIYYYFYRGDTNAVVKVHHHPNLVQQLNLELSQKNMTFPKNSIHVSKVIGQGLYNICAIAYKA